MRKQLRHVAKGAHAVLLLDRLDGIRLVAPVDADFHADPSLARDLKSEPSREVLAVLIALTPAFLSRHSYTYDAIVDAAWEDLQTHRSIENN